MPSHQIPYKTYDGVQYDKIMALGFPAIKIDVHNEAAKVDSLIAAKKQKIEE